MRTMEGSFRTLIGISLLIIVSSLGCSSFWSSRNSDAPLPKDEETSVRLIGDLARPSGMRYAAVESVSMVNGLKGTGSDPPPTSRRRMLIGKLQQENVSKPNAVLASPATSLVIVRGFIPPGAQEGDRIDVEVMTPSKSETTSLAGGYLLPTRLRDLAVLGNQIHSGHVRAVSEGSVLLDSMLNPTGDQRLHSRGRILGGGVCREARPLRLVLKEEHHSVRFSSMIGAAVNKRFHTFENGIKKGAATPKRDTYVDLAVHPRYRHNLGRYMRVVMAIPLVETTDNRIDRLAMLERELLRPESASEAAIHLEAIGTEASGVLMKGLKSTDPQVRFYAAEALGYLDDESAVGELAAAARDESAFRWRAFAALGSMNALKAHDVLSDLLHVESAEARYGAFRALQAMNPRDPHVQPLVLDDTLVIHEIATTGAPMVHVAKSRRPEIVVFGTQQMLTTPLVILAGTDIVVQSQGGTRVKVTRPVAGSDNKTAYCTNSLVDVIRTIVKVGGSYADVVVALQAAKAQDALLARLEFDALPRPGRKYLSGDGGAGPAASESVPSMFASSPTAERSAD